MLVVGVVFKVSFGVKTVNRSNFLSVIVNPHYTFLGSREPLANMQLEGATTHVLFALTLCYWIDTNPQQGWIILKGKAA